MKVQLLCVGRPRGVLADAIAEYESRLRHYFTFEVAEVREETFRRAGDIDRVRDEEGKRLLGRMVPTHELVALTRDGAQWSSERFSTYLATLAVQAASGATFAIGGAYGLAEEVLRRSTHRLSLSTFTLPHELARLVLTEQLYRAGTINRGEPYHKGRGA
ncbi:MAG TPA: 23S rRNA (pseudouridine(1915)-N(3))-methyltransferase RlmH [Longimicrobiaceae bacterium]|nr:23S rRNA (pseudouridine(1915)-N(3))-methyltransferase RlmH [Longimicrobiaceae bacterium]